MKIEVFIKYFQDYYKGCKVLIKTIDYSQEVVAEINNKYEVEINGWSKKGTSKFKGYEKK